MVKDVKVRTYTRTRHIYVHKHDSSVSPVLRTRPHPDTDLRSSRISGTEDNQSTSNWIYEKPLSERRERRSGTVGTSGDWEWRCCMGHRTGGYRPMCSGPRDPSHVVSTALLSLRWYCPTRRTPPGKRRSTIVPPPSTVGTKRRFGRGRGLGRR